VRLAQADVREDTPGAIRLMIFASSVYIVSVACVFWRKCLISKAFLLGAAIVFRLTLAPLAPGLSEDVYRYRWEGLVQQRGFNPYLVSPSDVERDETFARIPTPNARSGYGPITTATEWAAFEWVRRLTTDVHRQAFWMKLPAILFEAATLAVLSRALPVERLLIYAWCPVPIIEFWWNGHNDAMAVFWVVAVMLLARRQSWFAAHAALGLAIAFKWWPAVLWPLVSAKTPRWWRTAWIAPAVTVLAALPYWTPEWRELLMTARYMSGYVGGWRNNDSIYGLLLAVAGDQYGAKYLAFTLLALAIAWMIWRRWSLEQAALGAVVTMLLVSANCHPWYLGWLVPLAAFVPWPPLAVWHLLMPLAYLVLVDWHARGVWEGSRSDRWLIYGPFLLSAGIWYLLAKRKGRDRENGSGPRGVTASI
jgi:hypothetical protein